MSDRENRKPRPETIRDLMTLDDVSIGDVKKVAAALWRQNRVASNAFPAPYKLKLPNFDDLPEHVQGFIVKGLLNATVEPTFSVKGQEIDEEDFEPPTVDNEVI